MAAADNPYFIQPANPMQALMAGVQGFQGGQQRANEEQLKAGRAKAVQALQSGAPLQDVLGELINSGDVKMADTIANYAQHQASQGARAAQLAETKRSNLVNEGIARAGLERKDIPEKIRILQASGIDPRSPEGRQALYKLDEKLTPTDRKAITGAEDENANLESTVSALQLAKDLNPKAYSGVAAGARGYIGSNIPGGTMLPGIDKEGANATLEWQKLMSPEALKSMADTLKGATTDFELRTFISQLADPTTPPDIRGRIIDRLQTLAKRKEQINKTRMDQLRSGSYYKPGGGESGKSGGEAPATTQSGGDVIDYRSYFGNK